MSAAPTRSVPPGVSVPFPPRVPFPLASVFPFPSRLPSRVPFRRGPLCVPEPRSSAPSCPRLMRPRSHSHLTREQHSRIRAGLCPICGLLPPHSMVSKSPRQPCLGDKVPPTPLAIAGSTAGSRSSTAGSRSSTAGSRSSTAGGRWSTAGGRTCPRPRGNRPLAALRQLLRIPCTEPRILPYTPAGCRPGRSRQPVTPQKT